jgi:flagellar biosynthetic protein FlhB
MAESKPHEATPNWIKRAKREGNVARSAELSGLSGMLVGAIAIALLLPLFGSIDAVWIARTSADRTVHFDDVAPLVAIVCGVLVLAGLGGVTASMLQERPFFIFPKLKAERLNPLEGLKRMFSPEAAVSAARALLAFSIASAALVPTAREVFARGAGFATPAFFATLGAAAAVRVVLLVILVGALFAVFDVLLVRRRWRKKLRMSTYELRRDMRESEGDPRLRGRRRMIHRRMNAGGLRSVKKAAFVVTNPTHIAMALEYRPPDVAVPRVLVRAADEAARRVRAIAAEHDIPVVENVALARELYALTAPGDEIPIETYVAVAEIVNSLYRQRALA